MNEWLEIIKAIINIIKNNPGKTSGKKAIRVIRIKLFFAQSYKGKYSFAAKVLDNYLLRTWGIFVGNHVKIGTNFRLPHPISIVIGDGVEIGDNCIIYQNVTLGLKEYPKRHPAPLCLYPHIGNNVHIYSGAKIFGDISVGDNTKIGANSVVTKNCDADSVYAGIPAKKIR